MNSKEIFLKMLIASAAASVFAMSAISQTPDGISLSSADEIGADINAVPCKNKDRLEGVRKLFLAKGATEADIKFKDFKSVENLVVEKQGKSKEIIVVGAHYDEEGGGCGAIDNWSGIVIVANLYQTVKDVDTEKTIKFVAFGKEERGLIGSKAMTSAIPKDERLNYCAMVNLDSFGMAYPQVMTRLSDSKLIDLAEETAKKMQYPFGKASILGATSDSVSFMSIGVPSLAIHGLSDKWIQYLHTSRDVAKNVNASSVYYGYLFSLNVIAAIDAKKCDAFR